MKSGRRFDEAASDEAILSYSYWQKAFGDGSDPLSSTLRLGSKIYQIVGVASPAFRGARFEYVPDVWIPIESRFSNTELSLIRGRWLNLLYQARHDEAIAPIEQKLSASLQERVTLLSGLQGINGFRNLLAEGITITEVIAGIVFFVGCLHAGSLLIATSISRIKEFAIRISLGATPSRVFSQLLFEVSVVVASACVAGFFFADWILLAARSSLPNELGFAGRFNFEFSTRTMTLLAMLFVCTMLGFAAIPALHMYRVSSNGGILAFAQTMQMRRRASSVVVATIQLGLTTGLLIAGYLFHASLQRLQDYNPGYAAEKVIAADFFPPAALAQEGKESLFDLGYQRLSLLSGVRGVTYSQVGQFSGFGIEYSIYPLMGSLVDVGKLTAFEQRIGPDFVSTTGYRILSGRDFATRDFVSKQQVAIVNEAFANSFFGTTSVIGRSFRNRDQNEDSAIEIIGLLNDLKWTDLRTAAQPQYFRPFAQSPASFVRFAVLLGEGGHQTPASVLAVLRSLDAAATIKNCQLFSREIERLTIRERLVSKAGVTFGGISFLLAIAGIVGIVRFTIMIRVHELAIRLFLGASERQLIVGVGRQMLTIVTAGLSLGVVIGAMLSRWASSLFFGIGMHDLVPIVCLLFALVAAVTIAIVGPTWNFLRGDPLEAWRTHSEG